MTRRHGLIVGAIVIGSCFYSSMARAQEGCSALADGDLERVGHLMYASHQSSRENFDNSCPELDFIVDTTRSLPGAFGARLSGGGFGGSVIVLIDGQQDPDVSSAVSDAYSAKFGSPCAVTRVNPSCGASLVDAE